MKTTRRTATHLLAGHGEGGVEPLLECVAALEDGGQQEVEQRPELGQLVLQRRAGEQHAARGQVVRVQDLGQLAVVVLHAVALVHDHVLPAKLRGGIEELRREVNVVPPPLTLSSNPRALPYLSEHLLVFDDVLVRGEQHVELAAAQDGNEGAASSWRPLDINRIAFQLCSTTQSTSKQQK